MANLPLTSVIKEVQKMTNYGSNAKKLSEKLGLDVMNITWEDNARDKNSAFGPCISDMTLQVNGELMPVIRQPNFSDKTWDVSIDKIPIVVGNEKKDGVLKTITLREYLRSFDKYMTKPTNKSLNLLVTNKESKQKDTHVIMSSQACFLPIETGKETKFNVALYNYQSSPSNPAVLVIVATSKGSSAQIIEGSMQSLMFNNGGSKADFVAQRLSDNRKERNVELTGEMSKQERQDNVIVIIQVPLKQAFIQPPVFESFQYYPMASCGDDMDSMLECEAISDVNSKPDVEAAIVKVLARTTPICECGKEMVWQKVDQCYGLGATVRCNGCESISSIGEIWHCTDKIHPRGYDLCKSCGEKQLQWDELNGMEKIEREENYPIRVTLQYYKATSNGIVDEEIIATIASLLETSQSQADFVGSLVTDTNPDRPTEWIEEKKDDYSTVTRLLKDAFPKDWQNYVSIFQKEKFDDAALKSVDSKDDLSDVLPQAGDRLKFFKQIQQWKLSQ